MGGAPSLKKTPGAAPLVPGGGLRRQPSAPGQLSAPALADMRGPPAGLNSVEIRVDRLQVYGLPENWQFYSTTVILCVKLWRFNAEPKINCFGHLLAGVFASFPAIFPRTPNSDPPL